jgi:hypothetical protein
VWDGKRIRRLRPVVHPVVRIHPETGRKGLFVNQNFTKWIFGVSRIESESLLDLLHRHCTQVPEFAVRHAWQPGDVAFWDNRATLHYATDDYGDVLRIVHRVTVRGDRPYGQDGTGVEALAKVGVAAGSDQGSAADQGSGGEPAASPFASATTRATSAT